MGKLQHFIRPGSFTLAFLQQINEKDIAANGNYNNMSTSDKLKFIAGNTVGRVTGYYPFQDLTGSHPFALNPAAMINKWTGLGIGIELLKHTLPLPKEIKKAGPGLLWGGLLGGLMDAPARQGGGVGGGNAGTRQMGADRTQSAW